MADSFETDSSITLTLRGDDTVSGNVNGNDAKGKWTMVYDEGFDFSLGDFKFFTFNKYVSSGFEFESICD